MGIGSLALFLARSLVEPGNFGEGAPNWIDHVAQLLPYVCASAALMLRAGLDRAERLPWLLLGLAVLASATGTLYYRLALTDSAAYPSLSDGLWLSYYGLSFVGLMLLLRHRLVGFRPSLWFDGLIAALAIAAVASTAVIHPLLDSTQGNATAVATSLAYPVGDLLVLGLVLGIFALQGWRPDRFWALIGVAWLVQAAVDAIYLRQVAEGSYQIGGALDSLWIVTVLLISYAAWTPVGERHRQMLLREWMAIATPAFFTLLAVATLVFGNFSSLPSGAVVLALLALVAGVGRMVAQYRHEQQLRDLAHRDSLTGMLNRRGFQHTMDLAVSQAEATTSNLSLLIIDLDDFKLVNDRHGHLVGDMALERFAAIVRQAIRRNDAAARMGGEEFAVILRGADAAAALTFAERLRSKLEQRFAPSPTPLTATFGVSTFPKDGRTPEELHGAADRAMYAAKSLGKNRTVVSGPEPWAQAAADKGAPLPSEVVADRRLHAASGR